MRIEEAEAIAKDLTYRDNFKIKIKIPFDTDGIELRIVMTRPDVLTGEPGPLVSRMIISDGMFERMKEKDFVKFVSNMIKRMENHEADEWFKYKGVHVNEVHDNAIYKFGDEDEYV